MEKPRHTRQQLMDALDYNPETGVFRWKMRPSRQIHVGDIAGRVDNQGYHRIGFQRARYNSHRLAWLFMTGSWPKGLIDHRDGDRLNNAFANLRLANFTQNNANKKPYGQWAKGVTRDRTTGKFRASIKCNYKRYSLGSYHSVAEASAAYEAAAKRLFGEFARIS